MSTTDLITVTPNGLYCPPADIYIDPWLPVEKSIITHAHSDHAQAGTGAYLTTPDGAPILRARIGDEGAIETLEYGVKHRIKDADISFHSAGHVLGSTQVRVEHKGEVWVLSSDYKTQPDPTCKPFELVKCHTFITESTFGLPIYRWRPGAEVARDINEWWQSNAQAGKCSIVFGYALGKAQRILAGLDPTIGPIYSHGAVERITEEYRKRGVSLPAMKHAGSLPRGTKFGGSIILAPPSAQNSPWTRQFGTVSTAFASGWMRIRGTRRRKSIDKGFVLSDHADWEELNTVIQATGAERIFVTHGYASEMVNWLTERGIDAKQMSTRFEGEMGEMQPGETAEGVSSDDVGTAQDHAATANGEEDLP